MKRYCDECSKTNEVKKETVTREYQVKDVKVKVDISIIKCIKCGHEIYDKKNEIHNDIIVFDAYKKKKKLLTSSEIKKIREKYDLSQSLLSRILGFGEKTITRYENGQIQDRTHDNLLRLINHDSNFMMLLRLNMEYLKKRETKKVFNHFFGKQDLNSQYIFEEKIKYNTKVKSMGGDICEC